MTDRSPRIGLVAASLLDRQAFALLVERTLGCRVLTQGGYQTQDVWAVLRHDPDVVVVFEAASCAAAERVVHLMVSARADARVLLVGHKVTSRRHSARIYEIVRGYIPRSSAPDQLTDAIQHVLAGECHFRVADTEPLPLCSSDRERLDALTPRERELMILMAQGFTLRAAARVMGVRYKTADSNRTNVLRKLGLRDRVDVARFAIRCGLLEP